MDQNQLVPATLLNSQSDEALGKDKDPLDIFNDEIINFYGNPQEQSQIAYTMSMIIAKNSQKYIEEWDDKEYQDRSNNIKDQLYDLVEKIINDNENEENKANKMSNATLLNYFATAIESFSYIEYPKGLWQRDIDIIFSQLLIEDPNQKIIESKVYIYLLVIYKLLQRGYPTLNDPFYDQTVSNIIIILNTYLDLNEDNFNYMLSIKKNILQSINTSIEKFERYFNDVQNFKDQMTHLMNFIINTDNDELTQLIYQCFNKLISNYYSNTNDVMKDLFSITISHFEDTKKFQYALEFWGNVALTEKEIDIKEKNYHYILGVIPLIVEQYIFPFIYISSPNIYDKNNPEDDTPVFENLSEECLQSISLAEPSYMFEILSRYFDEHKSDPRWEIRLSALISYRCILKSFNKDENFEDENQTIYKFIENSINFIMEFAKGANEKLKYYALSIINIILKKLPSFIMSNRDIINDLYKLLMNVKNVHYKILSKSYNILSLIFQNCSTFSVSNIIFNNFEDLYKFISHSYKEDSPSCVMISATNYSKALVKYSTDNCNKELIKILNDYIDTEKPSNNFTLEDQIQLYLTPILVEKLQNQLNSNYILKIMNKMLSLFISNPNMYNEILQAIVSIIPFTKNNKFDSFKKELISRLFEYHKKNDPNTMKSTCYAFVELIEIFPKEMASEIQDILDLLINNLTNRALLQRTYPPIFYLVSSIVKTGILTDQEFLDSANKKINKENYYPDYLIDCINSYVSEEISFKEDYFDQELFDLYFEILNCYLALINSFGKDYKERGEKDRFNKLEKQTILFIKKLEHNDLCYNDILETSIKIFFIIFCVNGFNSFKLLSQPLLKRIIERGTKYDGDQNVAAVSSKILSILDNYA